MENITLTPRLSSIAQLVPNHAKFADIGTDHGHLPLWLLREGRIASAIASDINRAPLEHARENGMAHGLADRVQFILAGGLEGITANQCDTISIAGMGGETIATILQDAPWTAQGNHLLLLQAMTMVPELRQWLWAHGYAVEREMPCTEGRRHYTILAVRGGSEVQNKPLSHCRFTPELLQEPGATAYLQAILAREQSVLHGLQQAETPDTARINEQQDAIAHITQALTK